MDHSEATSVLLARLPVARLNELTAEGRFEAPVSGDDLAFERADLAAFDIGGGVCVSCGADAVEDRGLSRCCGSRLTFPGPVIDDRREP
jgi:hypothetical protein